MFEKLTFDWQLVGKSKMCSGNEYRVSVSHDGLKATFPYHTNYLDEKNNKEFLSCVFDDSFAYENTEDILDFKEEFGYEDNKKCREVYNACKDTFEKLHALFFDDEFEELYNEIMEGDV